jgi:hypothetical protein
LISEVNISKEARELMHVKPLGPRYELLIGGEPWTDEVRDLEVEYGESAGGSRLTFVSGYPLEHRRQQRVELYIGYGTGPLSPLFMGQLKKPIPNPPDFTSEAVALGPFAQMAEQHFGAPTRYTGQTVGFAIRDIAIKAYTKPAKIRIEGGDNKTIEDAYFAEHATLLEGAQSICEGGGFVMTDLPDGTRLFRPRPRPGSQAKAKFVFDESQYSTFSISSTTETDYRRVVVLRAGTELPSGKETYEVYAEALVPGTDNKGSLKNRTLYVTDFPGTQAEAQGEARDLALRNGMGEVKFTMEGIALDPNIHRYDKITASRAVERRDGKWRETYELVADEGVAASIPEWTMSVSGVGIRTAEHKIAPSRIDVPARSVGVIRL